MSYVSGLEEITLFTPYSHLYASRREIRLSRSYCTRSVYVSETDAEQAARDHAHLTPSWAEVTGSSSVTDLRPDMPDAA